MAQDPVARIKIKAVVEDATLTEKAKIKMIQQLVSRSRSKSPTKSPRSQRAAQRDVSPERTGQTVKHSDDSPIREFRVKVPLNAPPGSTLKIRGSRLNLPAGSPEKVSIQVPSDAKPGSTLLLQISQHAKDPGGPRDASPAAPTTVVAEAATGSQATSQPMEALSVQAAPTQPADANRFRSPPVSRTRSSLILLVQVASAAMVIALGSRSVSIASYLAPPPPPQPPPPPPLPQLATSHPLVSFLACFVVAVLYGLRASCACATRQDYESDTDHHDTTMRLRAEEEERGEGVVWRRCATSDDPISPRRLIRGASLSPGLE